MTALLSCLAALFVVPPAFFMDSVAFVVGAGIKRAPLDERARLVCGGALAHDPQM